MGKKRKHHRRDSDRRDRRPTEPAYDWEKPLPDLHPEHRLSGLMDYSTIVEDYDTLVAEVGKQEIDDRLDDLFFLLSHSLRLLDEPEFHDVNLGLDPHDFLLFEEIGRAHV